MQVATIKTRLSKVRPGHLFRFDPVSETPRGRFDFENRPAACSVYLRLTNIENSQNDPWVYRVLPTEFDHGDLSALAAELTRVPEEDRTPELRKASVRITKLLMDYELALAQADTAEADA